VRIKVKNQRIIFIGSEVLNQSAGTPRQIRNIYSLMKSGAQVIILALSSRGWVEVEELSTFKSPQLGHTQNFGNSKTRKLMRFFKQDLMLESLTPTSLGLYFLILRVCLKHRISHIYISSPPFPIFSIFLKLLGVKYIIDMRDPWGLHPTLARFTWLRRKVERVVLGGAAELTVATNFMSKEIERVYNITSETVYNKLTKNEFDLSDPTTSELLTLDTKFIISAGDSSEKCLLYCGTVPDGFYDIHTIMTVLRDVLLADLNIKLFFIGTGIEFSILEQLANTGRVVYLDRVNRKTAIIYVKLADEVLFFGHKFDGYLTTKLFEFFYLKKKIIPINLIETYEASNLILEYGQSLSFIDTADKYFEYTKTNCVKE